MGNKAITSNILYNNVSNFKKLVVKRDIDGVCSLVKGSHFGFFSSHCIKVREFQYLSAAYLKLELYEDCLSLLDIGCRRYPSSIPLMNLKAICHSRNKDIDSEIYVLERICRLQRQYSSKVDEKYAVRLERARKKIFQKEKRETIYFNDDNCLRYMLGSKDGRVLFVTFWGSRGESEDKLGDDLFYLRAGYAEKFLLQNGWDVLSVIKRKYNFYQDISLSEFKRVVLPILSRYEKVFMYGGSGGGYAALYYSIGLSSVVPIVFSPRVSIDPIAQNSRKQNVEYPEFIHKPISDHRVLNKAFVFYDPKHKVDRGYVENRVIKCFINAVVTAVPFSGHGAFMFGELGVVKHLVKSIVSENSVPVNFYNRKQSKIYHYNLASHLFESGKFFSALKVSLRALRILEGKNARRDKIDIYNLVMKKLSKKKLYSCALDLHLEFKNEAWFLSDKNKYPRGLSKNKY
ncbi:hypothetical protein ACSTAY_11765 [Vreelandella alkaliphila]